jgi:hypothetical protein
MCVKPPLARLPSRRSIKERKEKGDKKAERKGGKYARKNGPPWRKKSRMQDPPAPTRPRGRIRVRKAQHRVPRIVPTHATRVRVRSVRQESATPATPVKANRRGERGWRMGMGRRNEYAGLPAHERTHLPRVLCVHPRLEVGPEEGGGRGCWWCPCCWCYRWAGWQDWCGWRSKKGGKKRTPGRDAGRCGVVPILVLGGRGGALTAYA